MMICALLVSSSVLLPIHPAFSRHEAAFAHRWPLHHHKAIGVLDGVHRRPSRDLPHFTSLHADGNEREVISRRVTDLSGLMNTMTPTARARLQTVTAATFGGLLGGATQLLFYVLNHMGSVGVSPGFAVNTAAEVLSAGVSAFLFAVVYKYVKLGAEGRQGQDDQGLMLDPQKISDGVVGAFAVVRFVAMVDADGTLGKLIGGAVGMVGGRGSGELPGLLLANTLGFGECFVLFYVCRVGLDFMGERTGRRTRDGR
ncbi:unnamed protein product [Vitrella brassicaformis CCMP3155]|uniref:Uncharacterized protein n=1 Tax=Vitrella brassicaformis (strain CCMP3155) TaxID=1169540 RepID=A0A0G4FJ44_VITBC|nr:unnamed protein product [Vitrella brassicaformis CCMP3155]|eukprot:CEM13796.1 unnamed protein product [Vitrella brassicaformis CCMP3155]